MIDDSYINVNVLLNESAYSTINFMILFVFTAENIYFVHVHMNWEILTWALILGNFIIPM